MKRKFNIFSISFFLVSPLFAGQPGVTVEPPVVQVIEYDEPITHEIEVYPRKATVNSVRKINKRSPRRSSGIKQTNRSNVMPIEDNLVASSAEGDILTYVDESESQSFPAGSGSSREQVLTEQIDESGFELGKEEDELLSIAQYIQGKIPDSEWNEIAAAAKTKKYVVEKGDYLWAISKRLFGTGFYYSKIWAMNPHIVNPHEVEPGTVLLITTGDADSMPNVQIGEFKEDSRSGNIAASGEKVGSLFDFSNFGEGVRPPWLDERQKLINEGYFFQYAYDDTYKDIAKVGNSSLIKEYNRYDPPVNEYFIQQNELAAARADQALDSFRIDYSIKKDGLSKNTFLTTNVVKDLGVVDSMAKENVFLQQYDKIYVRFNAGKTVAPGDLYSIYVAGGKVVHKKSEREGYKYTIAAQLKTVRKIDNKWECEILEVIDTIQRGDRITVYTPKINKIVPTFNRRKIEAMIIGSYEPNSNGLAFGDLVYLDRGRADGVEMGTVFELYSFMDRGQAKRITRNPTYKIGELTVVTLTDNFATGLVNNSAHQITLGTLALTKTRQRALLDNKLAKEAQLDHIKSKEASSQNDLDVELNMKDFNKDLLKEAQKIQVSEDELAELERQEQQKSIITDEEKDIRELERLESEIAEAEVLLKEGQVDKDKYLEQQSLEELEAQIKTPKGDEFSSLNDLEDELGIKYIDEDINSKDNPYGLTKFDIEEIDELLNSPPKL